MARAKESRRLQIYANRGLSMSIKRILLSARFWLAGPVAFLLSMITMMGMTVWFPKGEAAVDNIVMPLVLFPIIWAIIFFYAYLDSKIKRVALCFSALAGSHIVLLAFQFIK